MHSLACHTLPYTCCLVESPEAAAQSRAMDGVEIRESKSDARPIALHETSSPTEHEKLAKHLPAHLQAAHASSIASPKSILINPMEMTDLHKSGASSNPGSKRGSLTAPPSSPGLREKHFGLSRAASPGPESSPASPNGTSTPNGTSNQKKWILTPRRGHAALNAGIRSLASSAEVTLVAWPGDMRRNVATSPEEEDCGDLTEADLTDDLKKDLDRGLNAIGGQGKGVRCRAVWLEDQMASDFYDGMCKGFLWPVFHYFVSSLQVPQSLS